MNSFYFDKMHMLYNKNKSCVKSCQKHWFFFKKTHCFPTCALFYPIVLKQKIITDHIIFLPAARSSFCSCPPVSFLIASVYSSGDSTSLWVVLILWNMDRAAKRIFFSRLEVFAHQITSSLLSSVTPAVHVRTVFHVLN